MKIMGLPLWGVLAASVALYFVGFLWYGLLFSDIWLKGSGYTEADFEGQSSMWMIGGFFISLFTVIGLGIVLKWRGWPDMGGAIQTALLLGVLLGGTFAAYTLIYSAEHSWPLFFVDASHLIVGWIVAAVVLTLMK